MQHLELQEHLWVRRSLTVRDVERIQGDQRGPARDGVNGARGVANGIEVQLSVRTVLRAQWLRRGLAQVYRSPHFSFWRSTAK